ncbi:pentapeptide repeat-containing protein [Corynebacterium sputi]|uniref:pentapeptide repeat-containing protein n=1 Tax=Corynebacterium sputi TaxID=489915 RepID=UPI000402BC04|nr:pentapeptide repeat-containing protein [Corynebacterium sputi]
MRNEKNTIRYILAVGIIGLASAIIGGLLAYFFGNQTPEWIRLAAGSITGFGALLGAWLIFHRGELDRKSQQKIENERLMAQHQIEDQRLNSESAKLRTEEQGRRRDSLGARTATAVEHLSATSSTTRSAGFIELAGIIDDWWTLGQQIKDETISNAEAKSVDLEILRRRQELLDLIFKQPPNDNVETETKENAGVLLTKSMILQSRLVGTTDPSSWNHLSFAFAQLRHLNCPGINFSSVNLEYANMSDSNFADSNFDSCNISFANLNNGHFDRSAFTRTTIKRSTANKASLTRTDFRSADILYTEFSDCTFRKSDLSKLDIFGSTFADCKFSFATFEKSTFQSTEITNCTITRSNYQESSFIDSEFFDCRIHNSTFKSMKLKNTSFTDSVLRGSDWSDNELDHQCAMPLLQAD